MQMILILKNQFVKGNTDDKFLHKQNFEHVDLPVRLKKLGRDEGKVLEINQKKFAVTPWLQYQLRKTT